MGITNILVHNRGIYAPTDTFNYVVIPEVFLEGVVVGE